ncbi:MAG: protoheme IX farnesyltransferase [candidate division Zixibacteria bacterium]|nr:protoheme IX farnesyltransferase [candidate division Zixibacteria bacterium]
MLASINNYIQLTKPTIMLLVVFTGSAALVVEGSFLAEPLKFLLVIIGLYMTGGCANALNQYLERDLDAKMERTKNRRPLPSGRLSPTKALIFSVSIGIGGVFLFAYFFNWLTALLALGTILFYSLYYTLWLKPNTTQNIVIGGIAGAMAPIGAWTAATNSMSVIPWLLFLIIFLWTPPHFWALALFSKKDYKLVGLPMMPVVKGGDSTRLQILVYTIILVISSLGLLFFGAGWIYGATAIILGVLFARRAFQLYIGKTDKLARQLFGQSLLYLFGVFSAVIVDALL